MRNLLCMYKQYLAEKNETSHTFQLVRCLAFSTDDYFKREALAAHNRYRTIHRAAPLKLDPQLSLEAERFAKHLAQQGGARHEIPGKLRREGEGENVARGCSEWGGLTASGAVHRW